MSNEMYWVVEGDDAFDYSVVKGDEKHVGANFPIFDGPYRDPVDAQIVIESLYREMEEDSKRDVWEELSAYDECPNLAVGR